MIKRDEYAGSATRYLRDLPELLRASEEALVFIKRDCPEMECSGNTGCPCHRIVNRLSAAIGKYESKSDGRGCGQVPE